MPIVDKTRRYAQHDVKYKIISDQEFLYEFLLALLSM